jgi:hypothetical protein
VVACISLAIPKGIAAQTIITLQAAGMPVAAAEVTLWDVAGRAGLGRTDGVGTVRIAPDRALSPGAFVLVRRIGYAPARVPFEMRDSMTIAMTAVAANLPALAVRTKALLCPSTTEPGADSLWRLSAGRYSMRLTQFTMSWTGYVAGETVSADQRGFPDPRAIRQPPHVPGRSVRGQPGMEDPPPYALHEIQGGPGGERRGWRYADLASYSADHFLSERFRERHSMVVLGESESATIIGFCPKDASQADVQGELQFGANASLIGARWVFRVPHDDEDAGGEATFAPSVYDGREYIVAIGGTFWRRVGKSLYSQRRFERVRWELHPRV